ncbi:metallopeptidase TldD-related protein [Actinomycetospora endophytica]|uniref:Metallopeptidase TldD-related protein n=1 Tax=Actinomycetospora endophytica TaxID=2291215 RepID=A0ABS8P3Z4_9PSEU|nr:metallopeptidase TldD-related protein [Actinomycetospora endophytica]MCD2192972.1 metallopeptidase TldD-related protein [Actinomycetospora endophytica]
MTAGPAALVERALDTVARIRPDAGAAVLVRETSEAVLRWANSTMTTNGATTDRTLGLVLLVPLPAGGTGAGVVRLSAPDRLITGGDDHAAADSELEHGVRAAVLAAERSGPARDAAELPPPSGPADTDFGDAAGETSAGVFRGLAEALGDSFGQDLSAGFADHHVTTTWLGTTAGVRRRWVTPGGAVEVNLKDPSTGSSVWGGQSSRHFTDVDLPGLLAGLRGRLAWGKRRVAVEPGRHETILPPSAVADFMIYLAWSMGGRPAQEGRSALSHAGGTRLGEALTALPLTLAGDPDAPGFPALAYEPVLATTSSGDELSVFDNGATTRRVDWLREGRVNELAYPRAAATEFADDGARFAPPSENLLLTGGSDASLRDMIASTRRGLLLTCLWYMREVDPETMLLTGLSRDGVYLVENGEVTAEVNNFRFNESPLDLVRRATEAGATERTLPREWKDWFTLAAMPPLRIPDFNMSSVSQAS